VKAVTLISSVNRIEGAVARDRMCAETAPALKIESF
jgi:hypothetical protein